MSSWKFAVRELLKLSENSTSKVNSLLSISQSGWIYLDLKTVNENEKNDEWQPWGSRKGSVLDTMSSKYMVSHLTLTKQQIDKWNLLAQQKNMVFQAATGLGSWHLCETNYVVSCFIQVIYGMGLV
jgi:hypothetical protein